MEASRPQGAKELDENDDGPCRLMRDEVHVWFASLRVSAEALEMFHLSLSAGERMRAGRFRNSRDRDDFIATHGIAREILGRYAGVKPGDVRFITDRSGRPVLDRASGGGSLSFSMSHSGAGALYGVARERNVGVDIELIDPELVEDDAAKRFLSPPERAALDALPLAARADMLFRFWTLKEAYLKARGTGLAIPPSAIDVSTALFGKPRAPAGGAKTEGGDPWTFAAIPVPPGYTASAAWRGNGFRIVCRLFEGRAAEPAALDGAA
jgi:4'-phosphopantetheinyl transferase